MEFSLNKGKIKFHLFMASLFLAACLAVVIDPQFDSLAKGLGIFGLLIFGCLTLLLVLKLRDSKPGLVVNSHGILDNSNYFSTGLIPWSRISGVAQEKIGGTKLIAIDTIEGENDGQGFYSSLFLRTGMHITISNLEVETDEIWDAIIRFRPTNVVVGSKENDR